MQAQQIENVFARSWELLTRNWIIIVPGLVIGLIAGIVTAIFNPAVVVDPSTGTVVGVAALAGGRFIAAGVSLLAQVLTIAYTTGMAGAAWATGRASLHDGAVKFREDGGRILAAIAVIWVIAIVLIFITFGLGALVFFFFSIYALPAVVLRNVGPFVALQESFRIASKRWIPTLIVVALIFVVALIGGVIAGALAFVPLLGPIVAAVVLQALVAYSTIVIVGEYLALRGSVAEPPPPTAV